MTDRVDGSGGASGAAHHRPLVVGLPGVGNGTQAVAHMLVTFETHPSRDPSAGAMKTLHASLDAA